MRWAIVADDLTGAADSAVAFADQGIATTVWLCEPEDFPDNTCCSVDAHARWQDAENATKAICKHVRKLRSADWLMLKIDSTLRGFVGAMVQGAWQSSGRKWALIVPAVPKQGRKIVNGKLFVHGRLVNELDLAKEQPAPVTTPFVAQRLRETGLDKFSLRHLRLEAIRQKDQLTEAIEQAAKNSVGLICDAETDRDLERVVSVAIRAPIQPLFVGASGLAKALAKVTGKTLVKAKPLLQLRPQKILIVVGSQQTLARKQLEFLAAKDVPVIEVSGENFADLPKAKVSAVAFKPNAFLNLALQMRKHCSASAQCRVPIANLLRQFDALIIVGGLTARTIFVALNVRRWELLGSLLPGVPFGVTKLGDRTLLIATKAGGFGTKQTLWQAVVRLQGL